MLAALVPVVVLAKSEMLEEQIQQNLEEARVIKYTVTFYRDKTYSKEEWDKTVNEAAKTIKRGSLENDSKESEFVEEVITSLKEGYTRSLARGSGIHGLIQVGIGDGECAKERCGQNCNCAQEYNGVCPCSAGGSCRDERMGCPCMDKDKPCNCSKKECTRSKDENK